VCCLASVLSFIHLLLHQMEFKSKIIGVAKSTTAMCAGVAASIVGMASAFAASGDTFSLTAPTIDNAQVATGGTGLMSFLATLIQNHFVLLFMFVGISLGVGFGLMIVRSVWHTKRG